MPTIDTVAALLTKAQRTDNEAEADAYLSKAQQLATLHAIDLATAAAKAANKGKRAVPVQRQISVGEPRKRVNKPLISLFSAIASSNDVMIDIAHNSTYVIAYGLPDDIETVENIWLACAPRMVEDATRWVRGGAWRGDYVQYWDRDWHRYMEKPATAHAAKAAFFSAFTYRIKTRLAEGRKEAIVQADAEQPTLGETGTAGGAELVLVAKADQVGKFYKQTSNARGSWRGYQGASLGSRSTSGQAGDRAGRAAQLGGEKKVGWRAGAISSS